MYEDEEGTEEEYIRLPLPKRDKNEMFAIADRLMGGSRVNVICEDGKSRLARIPGKMKRKQRVRTGDLLIIKPWDIQNEKADILFRYKRTQAITLSRRKLLPEELDVF
ncbi:MAG: translation initiation factor eIF-1A [Thermoplasmata archaeon]|nr:MAG: translation initiation factor eIF-1A [Thermoplasmata archaeon]